jgi:hypothetical protein
MHEIINQWKSPAFWVNGIGLVILGGVVSIFLYERFGRYLAFFSKKWQTRNEKLRRESGKRIQDMINNVGEQQFYLTLVIKGWIKAIIQGGAAFMSAVLSWIEFEHQTTAWDEKKAYYFASVAIFFTMLALNNSFKTMGYSVEISTARKLSGKDDNL